MVGRRRRLLNAMNNAGNDDATGGDTTCDVVLCAANERVKDNECVTCPAGKCTTGQCTCDGSATCAKPNNPAYSCSPFDEETCTSGYAKSTGCRWEADFV